MQRNQVLLRYIVSTFLFSPLKKYFQHPNQLMGCQGVSVVKKKKKNPPTKTGDRGLFPGSGRSLGDSESAALNMPANLEN